jgi:hypothetical protein
MEQRRPLAGAFHDYVRWVFAEPPTRVRSPRAGRTHWMRRLAAQRPASGAEQRWEGEGGSTA